jgi:hypothetical protein
MWTDHRPTRSGATLRPRDPVCHRLSSTPATRTRPRVAAQPAAGERLLRAGQDDLRVDAGARETSSICSLKRPMQPFDKWRADVVGAVDAAVGPAGVLRPRPQRIVGPGFDIAGKVRVTRQHVRGRPPLGLGRFRVTSVWPRRVRPCRPSAPTSDRCGRSRPRSSSAARDRRCRRGSRRPEAS